LLDCVGDTLISEDLDKVICAASLGKLSLLGGASFSLLECFKLGMIVTLEVEQEGLACLQVVEGAHLGFNMSPVSVELLVLKIWGGSCCRVGTLDGLD
jgi:hypothetical protein